MILSELNIYPIKSCHGVALAEARVENRGLQFDRRWMLVDENNRFLTQREFALMATIAVTVDSGQLTVDIAGRRISVPQNPPTTAGGSDTRDGVERVQIWSSKVRAAIYSDEVNEFFSGVFGARVRLVVMTEAKRPVNYWYRIHKDNNVSFADGYPFLLAGQASLDELNRRIVSGGAGESPAFQSIPMNRFRPNFVVEGSEPFSEDTWKKVRIGGTIFHVVKPCARCPIPTIDQETGARHSSEPTRTLSTFRQVRRAGKNKILFGQNLIADEPGGTVRVGDEVEVLEYR